MKKAGWVALFLCAALWMVGVTGSAVEEGTPLPVLMYHALLRNPNAWNDYVLSPDALEQDLKAALAKLKKQRRTGSGYRSFPYRESPSSDGRIRVLEKEILYLESMRHEIWVHCEKKVFLTSETLGYWEEKLRVRSFLRVHKSFLVNPGQISRIGREMIELEDGSRLPVSRYRYPEVMARYEAWIRHAEFLE